MKAVGQVIRLSLGGLVCVFVVRHVSDAEFKQAEA